MAALLMLAWLAQGSEPEALSPAAELRMAVDDLARRVRPEAWADARYLSLYAVPEGDRERAAAAVSFVLNAVSRADRIRRPDSVPDTGGRLLRISLDAYHIPPKAWELLAAEDAYWHLRTEVIDPTSGKRRVVFTDGGWVDLGQAARLREMTASGGALVRGDFFVARAATTEDGGHYYTLAGVPERESEFFAELGIDPKTIGRLHADEGANLILSRVTRQVRRIAWRQGPLGGAWQTYDVAESTAEHDPIRNPLAFVYEAGEHIAARSNGMHVFALYDQKGARQQSVPDTIAKDSADVHGSGIISPMISCVRCHVEEGLRPFANDQQRLLAGRVDLFTERAADAERLASFYAADLERRLERDREDYTAAVAKATPGLTVAEAAAALAWLYGRYVDEPVTPAQAALELGVSPERLTATLRTSRDPVLLALAEGMSVQRKQWEAAFTEAALLAAGEPK